MITGFTVFCLYVLGSVALRLLNFLAMGHVLFSTGYAGLKEVDLQDLKTPRDQVVLRSSMRISVEGLLLICGVLPGSLDIPRISGMVSFLAIICLSSTVFN
jgi:transposase